LAVAVLALVMAIRRFRATGAGGAVGHGVVVIWGAALDIRDAFAARKLSQQATCWRSRYQASTN
jgi:hypothetical protein